MGEKGKGFILATQYPFEETEAEQKIYEELTMGIPTPFQEQPDQAKKAKKKLHEKEKHSTAEENETEAEME